MRPFASAMLVLSLLSLAGLALQTSAPGGQGSGGGAAAAPATGTTTAQAPAKPPPDVEVLDTTASALSATLETAQIPHTWTVRGTAFLANRDDVSDRNLSLTCVLRTAPGAMQPCFVTPAAVQIVKSTPANAQPFSIALGEHALDDFPMSGYIAIAFSDTKGGHGSVKPFAISIKPGTSTGQDFKLFMGAFAWAFGVVLAAFLFVVLQDDYKVFGKRMGKVTWSFTSSWSSTITIGAALLTSFVGFVGLPEYGHTLSKNGYTITSLIAAAFVSLAPGIYNLFRKPVVGNATTPDAVQYQGLVVMFLVAAIFTITGALAQLELLRLMMGDLSIAGVMSERAAGALGYVWRAIQIVTVVYAGVSLVQTVLAQQVTTADENKKKVRERFAVPDALRGDEKNLPDWNLL